MGIGAYPQKQQNFLISRRQKWLIVGNRLESQAELKEISLKQRLECFSFWFTEKNLSPTVPFCYQWVNLSFKTKTWMLLFLITEKNLPPMVPFCYRWVDLASVKRVRFIWMISKITICRHWRYKGQYLMSTKIRIQGKLVSNFPQQKILLSHFQIAA